MATTYSARNAYQSSRERLRVLDTTAITYFLDRQSMLQRVTQAVQAVLPISQQFIVQNLQQVLKQRTAVGIFVLVSLLWSASNMFNNLAYEINMAWPEAKERNFVQSRLVGLDMIGGLTGLLILSIILDSLTKFLGGMSAPGTALGNLNPWAIVSGLGSWIAVFLLYSAMYHWVPTVPVKWPASMWGALAASVGWKAATTGFALYLASPFARYELVYGSLGAIVAFLFLIYIIALVTLFGAHLTSAVDHLQKKTMAAGATQANTDKSVRPARAQMAGSRSNKGKVSEAESASPSRPDEKEETGETDD